VERCNYNYRRNEVGHILVRVSSHLLLWFVFSDVHGEGQPLYALARLSYNCIVGYLLVEARHPNALDRVTFIHVVGLCYLCFSLVDRSCSWLFFLGNDILYKKIVVFSPHM
jgi:hypothetical protein